MFRDHFDKIKIGQCLGLILLDWVRPRITPMEKLIEGDIES